MARSRETFAKRGKEKKRQQKRMAKQQKREERKANADMADSNAMVAWVDEDGNIIDSPPEQKQTPAEDTAADQGKEKPQD